MVRRITITADQVDTTLENGTLPVEVVASASRVAVVLTQSWCGQWRMMKTWLSKLESEMSEELDVYELEYDTVSRFREFMSFKENVLGNDLVPFVLYYRDGECVGRSNYLGRDEFMRMFDS